MTKIAALSMYGKKPLKVVGTVWLRSLKLGMQHRALENNHVRSNDDPRLASDLFTLKSTLVPYVFCMGKRLNSGFHRNCCSL